MSQTLWVDLVYCENIIWTAGHARQPKIIIFDRSLFPPWVIVLDTGTCPQDCFCVHRHATLQTRGVRIESCFTDPGMQESTAYPAST